MKQCKPQRLPQNCNIKPLFTTRVKSLLKNRLQFFYKNIFIQGYLTYFYLIKQVGNPKKKAIFFCGHINFKPKYGRAGSNACKFFLHMESELLVGKAIMCEEENFVCLSVTVGAEHLFSFSSLLFAIQLQVQSQNRIKRRYNL